MSVPLDLSLYWSLIAESLLAMLNMHISGWF